MLREDNGEIVYYRFSNLAQCDGLIHGVFTRLGGVSRPPFAALNVGRSVGDDQEAVEANHALICEMLGIPRQAIATAHQVHGANVSIVGSEDGGKAMPETDALVTNAPGVFLLLRFADCVPLLLYDPVRRAVGLVHAGWKGTIGGIAREAISALKEAYGCRPSDMLAAIGPSIGPCCYQVGEDVGRLVKVQLADWPMLLKQDENGSLHFDLWYANRLQLIRSGIEQIEVAGVCTACHSDEFFSHRADGGRTGRFAVVVGLYPGSGR